MAKNTLAYFVLLIFFVVVGCKKEPKICEMKCSVGICQDGICRCPAGLDGPECSIEIRKEFLGTFSGSEISCSVSKPGRYTITIRPDPSHVENVRIENIWDSNLNTIGAVGPDKSIYIKTQAFQEAGVVTGKIMMVNGKLKISFSVSGVAFLKGKTDNCIWMQD